MNENLNKPEELDNTPPADEAHDIVAQAEAETPAEATAAPSTDSAKPKSKKPLVALLTILLLAIIGVCAYFLFFQSKPANNQNTGDNQTSGQTEGKTEDGTSSDTDSEASETAIEDQATISALFEKLLTLHLVGNYAHDATNYTVNQYFTFGTAYTVNEKIYANSLSNSDKFYITTQYMSAHGLLNPLTNYNVPENFLASKYSEYCQDDPHKAGCENSSTTAASEEEVAKAYKNIFGETPTSFESPISICGARVYDAQYHIFYSSIPGCGGGDNPIHQAYIEQYTNIEDAAYIYLRIATVDQLHYDNVPVYKTFVSIGDIFNSETNQTIILDESLIYSYLGAGGMGMALPRVITADNYTEFDQYRFVFQKDDDGNYYFKTVEKL